MTCSHWANPERRRAYQDAYDAEAAVDRVRHHMPGVQAEIIPGVGHLLGMQRPDVINPRVMTFLQATSPTVRPA